MAIPGLQGEIALYVAHSLDDINTIPETYTAELPDTTLFVTQAVEIEPGIVRLAGPASTMQPLEAAAFYTDFNVTTGQAGDVQVFVLAEGDTTANTVLGDLSPDGSVIPVYLNAGFTGAGSIYGSLILHSLTADSPISAPLPESVSEFVWQP